MPAAKTTDLPKTLVICKSVHHGNTARVADRIAAVLGAEIAAPEAVPHTSLDGYDLIGFGSGIYHGRFHETLWEWLRGLPEKSVSQKPAFVFSTSGLSCLWKLWHAAFKNELVRRGFEVLGEFHCPGFDTWGPLWIVGGLNSRHPDNRDLVRATAFARSVKAGFAGRLSSSGLTGQMTLKAD